MGFFCRSSDVAIVKILKISQISKLLKFPFSNTQLGDSRSVYFSSSVRDQVTSLIKSSNDFTFLTSIRQDRKNAGTIFAFSYGKYQTNRFVLDDYFLYFLTLFLYLSVFIDENFQLQIIQSYIFESCRTTCFYDLIFQREKNYHFRNVFFAELAG